jgi:LytS/YehU family sensor histidine kinase
VHLKEEMRTVLDYLELEKLRYEDRLRYTITVTPEAEEVQVPTMMVQTLVENAIKHGISKTVEGGEIEIRALLQDGTFVLEIENSGTLTGSPFKHDGGFGLANTKLRLQLLFGEAAHFDIFQAGKDRVIAQVIMPASLEQSTLNLSKLQPA